MTCINYPIPYELWIHIANFSNVCDYNLFFTNKKFFSLINHYKFDSNVIKFAVKQGNLDIIKYILELKKSKHVLIDNKRFKNIGIEKFLSWSCEFGHFTIVKFLVKQGANVRLNNNECMKWASRNGLAV
ncbi:putative ankyrin repeat protein [Cotonvirus japonicus]|uniref:Ankyrin repeat protein n=1 Tax=Cotonvirus japonicus TaxID=2811091 RepID=A0ABM7NRJ0_9VIRU|nr:putative ankyrin repeat protein [Cotonvirus japonicus]BCS82782.1 putative ankyrin repeat protein [Cotonvirus japonicus]